MHRRKCDLLSRPSESIPIIVELPETRPAFRTLILENPKPSSRYSFPVFLSELVREVRWGLFPSMSEREWTTALDRREVVVSPSGSFVTVNTTAGFRVIHAASL